MGLGTVELSILRLGKACESTLSDLSNGMQNLILPLRMAFEKRELPDNIKNCLLQVCNDLRKPPSNSSLAWSSEKRTNPSRPICGTVFKCILQDGTAVSIATTSHYQQGRSYSLEIANPGRGIDYANHNSATAELLFKRLENKKGN